MRHERETHFNARNYVQTNHGVVYVVGEHGIRVHLGRDVVSGLFEDFPDGTLHRVFMLVHLMVH